MSVLSKHANLKHGLKTLVTKGWLMVPASLQPGFIMHARL